MTRGPATGMRWGPRACALLVGAAACSAAAAAAAQPAPAPAPAWGPIEILGVRVAPGEARRTVWLSGEGFAGALLATPVLVVRGAQPGPALCLTAGVHGDELNGIEVVRRSFAAVEPRELHGTLIGVPIVNLAGFRRSSRYLPDRRDLNRYFPGRSSGSSAARIARSFFDEIVARCDFVVDIHTGSFHRTNLPHIRADLENPQVFDLARGFGASILVHGSGTVGSLRRAATDAGIPAITYEAGEPMRFQLEEVARGEEGITNLLAWKSMVMRRRRPREPDVFRRSRWVRVDDGGILISRVHLGDEVHRGDLLGAVTDPVSNDRHEVRAPFAGVVVGMALNQVVIPGFAAFHLGIRGAAEGVPPAEDSEDWGTEAPGGGEFDAGERPE